MMSPVEPPFFAPKRWEAVLPILCAIMVDQIFDWLSQSDRGTIASASTLALVACVRMSWRLRRQAWFWITFGLLVLFHISVIVVFSWTGAAGWNGLSFIPFAAADVLLVMTSIYLVYRFIRGRPDQLFADD